MEISPTSPGKRVAGLNLKALQNKFGTHSVTIQGTSKPLLKIIEERHKATAFALLGESNGAKLQERILEHLISSKDTFGSVEEFDAALANAIDVELNKSTLSEEQREVIGLLTVDTVSDEEKMKLRADLIKKTATSVLSPKFCEEFVNANQAIINEIKASTPAANPEEQRLFDAQKASFLSLLQHLVKHRDEEWQADAFLKKIDIKGYVQVPVRPDGNCFYHAALANNIQEINYATLDVNGMQWSKQRFENLEYKTLRDAMHKLAKIFLKIIYEDEEDPELAYTLFKSDVERNTAHMQNSQLDDFLTLFDYGKLQDLASDDSPIIKDGVYAENIFAYFLSMVTGRPVHIYSNHEHLKDPDTGLFHPEVFNFKADFTPCDLNAEPIRLVFVGRNHFNAVISEKSIKK